MVPAARTTMARPGWRVTDIDNEARREIAELRNQLGQLTKIVSMQGDQVLELEAKLNDQSVMIEIALKTVGM
jgi:hypothetical protein